MILHVNTWRAARSRREIAGLPAFAAAPRPSAGLAPGPFGSRSSIPNGPGVTDLYWCSPGTAGTAVSDGGEERVPARGHQGAVEREVFACRPGRTRTGSVCRHRSFTGQGGQGPGPDPG